MLRAISLTLALFSLYWLTASGAFHSIDEEAVFAVARNLVFSGEAHQNTLFRAAPYIDQAKIGIDRAFYSKYGIGHAIALTPVLWLAQWIPGATLASSAVLVNMLATALTGGILMLTALRRGYSERAGLAVGLLYGAATFAWVYAKTIFSEPLVAFWWLAALYPLLPTVSWRRALLSGICLAIALSVRPASVLVTPLFALLLVNRSAMFRHLVAWAIPIAAVGLALLWFNAIRFGNPLDFGYSEGFDGNILAGLQGFLVSPDRSLFLFAPPLLLLFWAVPIFVKTDKRVGGTLLAISLLSLFAYSAWAVFWGGPVWGPRYLLPVLPLLFVLLIPAIARATDRAASRRWQVGLFLLTVAGFAMQLPGVLWNSLPLTQTLGQRYPLWTLAPQGEWLDLAWLAQPQGLVLSGFLLFGAVVGLVRPRLAWVGAATVATAIGTMLLLGYLGSSNFGYRWESIDRIAFDKLDQEAHPGDALILNPAPFQTPFDRLIGWMNRPRLPTALYGVLRDSDADASELDYILSRHDLVWLMTQGVTPGERASGTEWALSQKAAPVRTEWLDDSTRLSLFERLKPHIHTGAESTTLGDLVTLRTWTSARGSDSLQISIHWQPNRADVRNLHTFVQLLDSNGQLIAGWDSVPQFGFMPATTWRQGEPFVEHVVLPLPSERSLADTVLIAGMVDAASGVRLQTETGMETITLFERGAPIAPAP